MQLREQLIAHHNELSVELAVRYRDVLHSSRKRSFHRLRLAMKKHRSFLKLLRSLGFTFILPGGREKWNELYAEIGEIRDCQIAIKHVKEAELQLGALLPYSTGIGDRELALIEQFHHHHDRVRQTAINGYLQTVQQRLEQSYFEPNQMDAYFAGKIDELAAALYHCAQNGRSLHRLRKIIKELLINFQLLDELAASPEWSASMLEWKAFAKALGKWNDLNTSARSITENTKWAQRIKASIQLEADQQKEELLLRLPFWREKTGDLAARWAKHDVVLSH